VASSTVAKDSLSTMIAGFMTDGKKNCLVLTVLYYHEGFDKKNMVDGRPITTGMKEDAEGRHLRRRPNVGAVGVGRLQKSPRRRPSA
jgi:hypothetical protein